MERRGDEVHVDDMEASGGSKEGVVRWVLIGSTLFAIVALSLIWIIPSLMQTEVEQEATVSGTIQAAQDEEAEDRTDSILIEDADELEDAPPPGAVAVDQE